MPEFGGDFQLYMGMASLGAMAILSFLVVFLSARGIKRQWARAVLEAKQFADREPLTLDQFYELFYSAEKLPRAAVLETVSRFAAAAHVPAQFLKPDDTFETVSDEHPADRDKFITDTAILLQAAEERYGASLFSGKLVTLDDYIRVNVLASRLIHGASAKASS